MRPIESRRHISHEAYRSDQAIRHQGHSWSAVQMAAQAAPAVVERHDRLLAVDAEAHAVFQEQVPSLVTVQSTRLISPSGLVWPRLGIPR